MSGIKSGSKKKRAPVRQQRRAGGGASAAAAASAAPAPAAHAYAQPEDADELAAALESVEELLEQSDLSAAERLLRSPALLGRLRAADIQQQHAHLVPAMELLAQVLMEKSRTKEAFTVRRATSTAQHVPRSGVFPCITLVQFAGRVAVLNFFPVSFVHSVCTCSGFVRVACCSPTVVVSVGCITVS
jgi:hypothetical protein